MNQYNHYIKDGYVFVKLECESEKNKTLLDYILKHTLKLNVKQKIPKQLFQNKRFNQKIIDIQNFLHNNKIKIAMNKNTGEKTNLANKFIANFGEIYAKNIWDMKHDSSENYDYIYKQKTVDVKTKTRNANPKPYFDVTLEEYLKHKKKPDYYLFCQFSEQKLIKENIIEGFYLGTIKAENFWKKATFAKKGQKANGIGSFKRDNWKINIADLAKIKK